MEWLPTAGPYGALGAIILYLVRLLLTTDRRHAAEMKRVGEYHASEMRRINTAHDQEIGELRGDIASLRSDIADLKTALEIETDARRRAEEAFHQFRTGGTYAGYREGPPTSGDRPGDPGDHHRPVRGVEGPGARPDSDGPGAAGIEGMHPRSGRRAAEGA